MEQEKIKQFIISQREAGVPDEQIHSFLVKKGAISPVENPLSDANEGTGFSPRAEFTGEESLGLASKKTIANIPKSAFEFGKNIVSAVTHPKRTIQTIGKLVKGVGGLGGEALLERTGVGQKMLANIEEKTGQRFQRDAEGRIQAKETEELLMIKGLGDFFEQRYGSIDAIKETVVEDPVGFLADIAGVVSGVGLGAKATGLTGKVAQVGAKLEPIGLAGRAVATTGQVARRVIPSATRIKQIARDVVPSTKKIAEKALVDSFNFTKKQISDFKNRTGATPLEYLRNKDVVVDGTNRKLLGNTPEETLTNVQALKKNSYEGLRSNLEGVPKTYGIDDVPRARDIAQSLVDEFDGIVGREDDLAKAQEFLNKTEWTLSDAQALKEMIDENWNIYNKSGDVKAGQKAKGLDNLRKGLKEFIETEADNFDIDVKGLNEDVSFAYKLEKAIDDGIVKDLGPGGMGMTDWIIGAALGVGFFQGGIGLPTALGLFGLKRLAGSPAFKIAIAESLSSIKDARLLKMLEEVQSGSPSQQTINALKEVVETAKQNAAILNPTLDIATEQATE